MKLVKDVKLPIMDKAAQLVHESTSDPAPVVKVVNAGNDPKNSKPVQLLQVIVRVEPLLMDVRFTK